MSRVQLRTDHADVESLVSAWLAESRLVLPRSVTLEIHVAASAQPPSDHRKTFRFGPVLVRSGPATEDITLEWYPGLGHASIAPGSTTARITITEQGLERPQDLLRSFLLCACILLVRRVGLHHVHSATLRDPRDRDWLLVGPSRSGKSTTTALLARHGWSAGTDDIAFFTAGTSGATVDVLAWRERFALLQDAVIAGRHEGGTARPAGKKTGWYAEELGSTWLDRVTPELLAFPTVHSASPTAVTPLRPKEALTRVIQSSSWVALESDLADEHLDLMNRLVRQAPAFDLSLGKDLIDRPDLLLELLP